MSEQKRRIINGKSLYHLLRSAGSRDRLQWCFNNLRLRQEVPRQYLSLLSSGSSPNEALHHEINNKFRNLPEVYAGTIELQLMVCSLATLMVHNAALYIHLGCGNSRTGPY